MRAIGYSRVSTEEQATEGHSIGEQNDRIKDYVEREKWEFMGQLIDPGFSGKNTNRPDMKRLLNEVECGNVDIVIVHKLDRLTRDIGDLYDLLKLFEQHKIQFVSVSEKIDTSTAMGRMFVFLLGLFAQWYRENLSEEVRKGMTGRAKKGLHNVTVPLYGYTRSKAGELIIKPDESRWVQWIFEQYLNGIGSTSIAKRLNEMGIRRNRGALWDQHKVMMTLNNLHYIGKIHWKAANLPESDRIIRDGQHEAIVTSDIFEKAKCILQRRKDGQMSLNSYEYVFGGILRCGSCGGSYKGKYNKRSGDLLYRGYSCSNGERYGNCKQSGISEIKVAKLIFEALILDGGLDILNGFIDQSSHAHKNEKEDLEGKIKASEARRTRWQMAYGDGNMPYDDFSKRMREEMEHLSEWTESLSQMPDDSPDALDPKEVVEILTAVKKEWGGLEQATRKQTMQSLFRKIVIHKNDDVWVIKNVLTV